MQICPSPHFRPWYANEHVKYLEKLATGLKGSGIVSANRIVSHIHIWKKNIRKMIELYLNQFFFKVKFQFSSFHRR